MRKHTTVFFFLSECLRSGMLTAWNTLTKFLVAPDIGAGEYQTDFTIDINGIAQCYTLTTIARSFFNL